MKLTFQKWNLRCIIHDWWRIIQTSTIRLDLPFIHAIKDSWQGWGKVQSKLVPALPKYISWGQWLIEVVWYWNRRGPLILIFGRLSHRKLKTKLFTKNKNKFECLFLQIKQFRLYQCFFHERKLVFGQTLLHPLVGKKSQLAPKIAVLSNKTMQGTNLQKSSIWRAPFHFLAWIGHSALLSEFTPPFRPRKCFRFLIKSSLCFQVMHELARRLGHQSKDFNDA